MNYKRLLELIKEGQKGEYPWIPFQQEKMDKHIGIGKRLYHLVGGDPGTGKTSFVDQNYVLDAYQWYKFGKPDTDDTEFRVIYFSMERSKEYKQAKWLAMRLWEQENILLDVPTILGWGTAKRKLTDFEEQKIVEYESYYNEMSKYVHVLDGARNPTGVYKQMVDWALKNGREFKRDRHGTLYKKDREKYLRSEPYWEEVLEDQLPDGIECSKYDEVYVPNNPKLITLFVIDHIGMVRGESNLGDKGILDKMSSYVQELRDFYGFCGVVINQFNRNNSNIMRRVNTDMSPEKQDFKGSGNMYEDADIVQALFNPYEFGIASHLGYKVKKFVNEEGYNRFRSVTILKNSYGVDNISFGCQFLGECGFYRTLPKAADMTDQLYDEVVYPNGIV